MTPTLTIDESGAVTLTYPGGEVVECATLGVAEGWLDYLDNVLNQ